MDNVFAFVLTVALIVLGIAAAIALIAGFFFAVGVGFGMTWGQAMMLGFASSVVLSISAFFFLKRRGQSNG